MRLVPHPEADDVAAWLQPSRPFAKFEGLGNDFVIVDVPTEAALRVAEAVSLCDRRRGVGADGVLLVLPPRAMGAAARMKVINADGSVPEMCGNGLRCVALHVALPRGAREVEVETDSGIRRCTLESPPEPSAPYLVTVDMGVVRVLGKRSLEVDGRALELWLVDAGNPHAVLLSTGASAGHSVAAPLTDRPAREDIERLGPLLATHAAFREGTNVGFATVRADGLDLVVWERGVGLTLACGTGACAAAAVACERGLLALGRPIDVRLPGGTLTIQRESGGETRMRGPARHVFSGVIMGAS